jgi:hypothetical protein
VLEHGFVADPIQVGVVSRRLAKLLRHLDGAPEVVERVTCPAEEALATGEVEEQHGVLRSSGDHGGETIGDLGVFARLVERGEGSPELPAASLDAFPGVPSRAMMVVPSSFAEVVRLVRGGAKTKVPAGASTRSPSTSCSLMTRSPAAPAVHAVTSNAVMPS